MSPMPITSGISSPTTVGASDFGGLDKLLGLLPREQVGGVLVHDFGKMCDQHGRRVDHGVAGNLGVHTLCFGYPGRGQTEGGLDCVRCP